MNRKQDAVMFLWVATAGLAILTASFDLVGDNAMTWAKYLVPSMFSVTMVASAAIWSFTYSCHSCGKLVRIHDNYCRRCGVALLRPMEQTVYEQEGQVESIQESVRMEFPPLESADLPPLQHSTESNPLRPNRLKKRRARAA